MTSTGPLVKAYIDAMKGRGLYIHTGLNRQVAQLSLEPDRELETFATFWFAKPAHAELVLMRCENDFVEIGVMRPHGWIDLKPQEVHGKIVDTARLLGARWQTEAEIERDAAKVVDEIIDRVEAMRVNGGLAQFNADYKTYRQAQIAKCEKAVTYSAHLAAFTRSLVARAAKNAQT